MIYDYKTAKTSLHVGHLIKVLAVSLNILFGPLKHNFKDRFFYQYLIV